MAKRLTHILLCLVILAFSFPVHAETGVEEVVSSVLKIPDQGGFSVGAKGAVVIEGESGRVLFAQNASEHLPMASTTKIMTALLALEQPNLDEPFLVDTGAIQVEGSSMGLQEGDTVTLRALASGMLASSGNDAANAAAVRISGSVEEFVKLMNRRAAEIGLMDTSFETPSGLDGENHYSTAYDMALLAREALKNESFAAICSQSSVKTEFGNPPYVRSLTNHNRLLRSYEPAIGVKTGFTKKSGRCLVSAAQKDGVYLIAVTLKCPDDWDTHINLYDTYFKKLTAMDLTSKIPEITLPVTGGTQGSLQLAPYGASLPALTQEEAAQVEVLIEVPRFVYAPVERSSVVGTVRYMLDDSLIGEATLVAGRKIPLLHPYVEPEPAPEKTGFGEWLISLFKGKKKE